MRAARVSPLLLLLLLATAPAADAADAALTAGPAACRFAAPAGWPLSNLHWTGGCDAGTAQGLGVLRGMESGRVTRVFYGRLEAGLPALGALEVDKGYAAGRFEHGKPVVDGDRNALILAFDAASAAARQAADAFAAAGNAGSARFYRAKAWQLAQQLD